MTPRPSTTPKKPKSLIPEWPVDMGKYKQQEHDRSVWMNHNTLERGNPVKKFKGDL